MWNIGFFLVAVNECLENKNVSAPLQAVVAFFFLSFSVSFLGADAKRTKRKKNAANGS